VRDGGDELGPAALEPRPLLRAAQADDEAANRARTAVAHVADGDEELGAVGQEERSLRVSGAGGQAVVRVDADPPVAAVLVAEGQHVEDVLADRLVGGDGGEPDGGPVEDDQAAGLVGHDEAVGQLVGHLRLGVGHGASAEWGRHGCTGGTYARARLIVLHDCDASVQQGAHLGGRCRRVPRCG
jgi:hypothetical protein